MRISLWMYGVTRLVIIRNKEEGLKDKAGKTMR